MTTQNQNALEMLITRLDERMAEVLRRLDNFENASVSRNEFALVTTELRSKHNQNQKDIELMQRDLRTMMVKLGAGLGSLNVVTALALYLITRGA